MTNSLIVLGVMLAVLVAGSFVRKIPVAVLLVIASIAGADRYLQVIPFTTYPISDAFLDGA